MHSRPTVLLVDDEILSLETLSRILDEEFEVRSVVSAEEALHILANDRVQVVLSDQRMPGMSGVEFLAQVREHYPDVIRIIISGYTDADDLIQGINAAGIYQFINKPWHPDALLLTVRNAARLFQLQQNNELLTLETRITTTHLNDKLEQKRNQLKQRFAIDHIVRAPSSSMNAVCEQVRLAAPYDISVLITGPSGTGKEEIARALHYNSLRADQPFIIENCGAVPDELLESELFGHKRGAFTGAYNDRVGLLEQAEGGTVFLDEIGDVSAAFQVKLLRFLQNGEIRPVGVNQRRQVNVRVIAATNRDLTQEVHTGRFREDLYYRLAAMRVRVPPLHERPMDIVPLAQHMLDEAMQALGKSVKGFTEEALACLQQYHWPGNVRELKNEVLRALVLCQEETINTHLLAPEIVQYAPNSDQADFAHNFLDNPNELINGLSGSLKQRVEALEAQLLREALIRHSWNKSRAAEELGLSRVGLRNKLERYGLEPELNR